jgi:hypothetical protein
VDKAFLPSISPPPKIKISCHPVEAFLFIKNDFYCLKFVDGLSFGYSFTGNVEEAKNLSQIKKGFKISEIR